MVVGTGLITIRIDGCRSLKDKRKVIKAMIARLQNAFNVSVAEVGANDIHQRGEIGFAVVGNSTALVNSKVDKILNMAEDLGMAEVIDCQMEIIVS